MNNVNAIFDAAVKVSRIMHLRDDRRNKLAQIKSAQSERCGNCDHWMKSSCMWEEKLGQFRTTNDMACNDFVLGLWPKLSLKKFAGELHEIERRLREELTEVLR